MKFRKASLRVIFILVFARVTARSPPLSCKQALRETWAGVVQPSPSLLESRLAGSARSKSFPFSLERRPTHCPSRYQKLWTEMTDENVIRGIARGFERLRSGLPKDVNEMCEFLQKLRTHFDDHLAVNPKLNQSRKLFDDGCSAIYWSLKLHLALHCGNDNASRHENLKKLGRSLKINELDNVPREEHAVDPGSKVLELVSTQFLSCKGVVTAGNLCRNLSRNFFATKVPTFRDKFLDR